MKHLKVYMAGPDVFRVDYWEYRADTLETFQKVNAKSDHLRLEPVFPSDATKGNVGRTSEDVYDHNIQLMQQSQAIVANLQDFNGASADVGTAFEMGFMAADDKIVVGYKEDQSPIEQKRHDTTCWSFEKFGLQENLMLIFSNTYTRTGTKLHRSLKDALTAIMDWEVFDEN